MTTTAPVAANDNVRQFYVYQHRRNDTGEVFYIGKGCRSTSDRSVSKKGRSKHWHNIVNKHGYTIEMVCDGLDERHAFELETWLIAFHGRRDTGTGRLVNLTDGGEGDSGRVPTAEHRARQSAAQIGLLAGERHPMYGKRHTDESNAKRSASLRGRKMPDGFAERASARMLGAGNPMFGHRDTPETTERRRLGKAKQGPRSGRYKGVSFHTASGRYRACAHPGGRAAYLGYFSTQEDAARAYDAAAIAEWGAGNCYLNFPAEHGLAA